MKRIFSVLLCMAMLVPMLGAAAPLDEAAETAALLCEKCLELGCTQDEDGTVTHMEGCPCGQTPDGGEAGTCPCECAACGDASLKAGGDSGEDQTDGSEGNDTTADDGNENGKAGTTNDSSPANGPLPAADSGDFTVTGGTDYSYSQNVLTITGSTAMTISGTSTKDTIKVAAGVSANITISNLSITSADKTALDFFNAQAATLTLEGTNTLQGGNSGAGIRPPQHNLLTISGSGSLDVSGGNGGAGIGGESGEDGGAVTISGGTITVRGGAGAAGIGAGSDADDSGSIAIEGGSVTAIGSPALSNIPMFRSYVHLTYGNTAAEANKDAVEWTGNSASAAWYTYQWVKIQSMTVDSLEVSPAEASLKPGESQGFSAVLNVTVGGEATTLDVTKLADWTVAPTSGGSEIGKNTGELTIGAGETAAKLTVTASYTADKAYTASAAVTVLYPATSVKLDKTELKLGVGDTATLKAAVEPENTYDTASWSASPSGIITVDKNGKITAVKPGTATVTVTVGNQTATCTVTVYAKKYTITFDPNGGVCDTKTATTKDDGTLASLPKATKEGLYFAHWYTAKEGGERVYTTTVFDKDTTLYARWSTTPVTGDENDLVLWAVLLGVSALAIGTGTVYFFRKKRKGKEQ